METATPLTDTPPSEAAPRTATAAPARPEQPCLPLELDLSDAVDGPAARSGSGPTAPADSGPGSADAGAADADAPIGFALTARARRAVAPSTLPDLSVVGRSSRPVGRTAEGGALEEPDDTRPARARALRRAGVPVAAIASQLGADALAVTAWVGEVAATHRRTPAAASGGPSAPVPDASSEEAGETGEQARDLAAEELEVAHQLARADAAARARARLREDAPFAVAAGLLAATATADAHAVTLTAADPRTLARVLELLRAEEPRVATLARVVLRVGPGAAGDLLRHRAAQQLGVDVDRVAWTRWKQAPDPGGFQVLVRVADPTLAATVAGWVDAVLEPELEPVDLAF